MRFVFIVQGEGRGHMTQAISLSAILRENGHEIAHTIVGCPPSKSLPQFFLDKINTPVTRINSPGFVKDKKQKSVKPLRTVVYSIWNTKTYRSSIQQIAEIVKETKPDVIINFYDFLGGVYNFFHRPKAKFVCVAHQYLLSHPEFPFPDGRKIDKLSLKTANRITRLGADKVLALAFKKADDIPKKNIFVVPPLLRKEVQEITTSKENHVLVYMVNAGYAEEVERFHETHPSIPMTCFWDRKDKPKEWKVDDTLTFNQLDDKLFLEKMASCKGFITTAGFESVCEAMHMNKPVLMVPVEGHYEQLCNALDARQAGAGTYYTKFDISKLINYLPQHEDVSGWYNEWVSSNKELFLHHLTD